MGCGFLVHQHFPLLAAAVRAGRGDALEGFVIFGIPDSHDFSPFQFLFDALLDYVYMDFVVTQLITRIFSIQYSKLPTMLQAFLGAKTIDILRHRAYTEYIRIKASQKVR
jgi:hypothetical protein